MAASTEYGSVLGDGLSLYTGNVLGISRKESNEDAAQVIITSTGNWVAVYQIDTQKPVNSWNFKNEQKFVLPVVFDSKAGVYATVQKNNTLCTWTSDSAKNKCSKTRLQRCPVRSLHGQPKLGCVLVFEDGTHRLLSQLLAGGKLDEPSLSVHGATERVVWSELVENKDGKVFLAMLILNEKTKEQSVHVKEITGEEAAEMDDSLEAFSCKCALNPANHLDKLTSFAITCSDQENFVFVYSSSNGSFYKLDLSSGASRPLHFLNCGESSLQLAMLTSELLALAFTRDETVRLQVWDLKYALLQAHRTLKGEGSEVRGLLAAAQSCLLVGLAGGGVRAFPYYHRPLTLESVVGAHGHSCLRADWKLDSWNKDKDDGESLGKISELMSKLTDTSKTESMSDKKFLEAVEHVLANGETSQYTFIVSTVLNAILSRCAAKKTFWCRETLFRLIQSGSIDASSCSMLFTLLQGKNEVELLAEAQTKVHNIPENIVCGCLKYYLGLDEDQLNKSSKDFRTQLIRDEGDLFQDMENPPVNRIKACLIMKTLKSPFNDVFLLDSLKMLSFDHTKLLLSFLKDLMEVEKKEISNSLGLAKISEWVCLILDAHFSSLVLVPEAKEILTDLYSLVENQVQFYQELGNLESGLNHLLYSHHEKPQITKSTAVYKIESFIL